VTLIQDDRERRAATFDEIAEWLFAAMRRLIGMRPDGRVLKRNRTTLHLARVKALPIADR
jgi:hypothetical protein